MSCGIALAAQTCIDPGVYKWRQDKDVCVPKPEFPSGADSMPLQGKVEQSQETATGADVKKIAPPVPDKTNF